MNLPGAAFRCGVMIQWIFGWALFGASVWLLCFPPEGIAEEGDIWKQGALRIEDPVEIRADRLELRRQENLAVYSGQVVASQRGYRLQCNRLEVHWDPETRKIGEVVAHGDVKLRTEDSQATSGMANLDLASQVIMLTQSPRLTRGEESVEGDRIIYSIAERKSTVLGGKGRRVETRIITGGKP